jgi:hypothetical protein
MGTKFSVLLLLLSITVISQGFSQELLDPSASPEPLVRIQAHAETGFVHVINHIYRIGSIADGNSDFDYVRQGGQDVLFPYARFSVDAILAKQHRLSFLYQPLTIKTQSVAGRNGTGSVQIDNVAFADGTPINLTYGFDFFRLSYLYDFLPQEESQIGVGISFQLRNANIDTSSADGELRVVQDNIGLVPIIKLKAAHRFSPAFGLDFEGDGFYASSAFFNGSGRPFEGWIWDASLKVITRLVDQADAYVGIRTIGGGASGSNAYDFVSATTSSGGETYNSLATFALTLGVTFRP